jgi:hypothetical protein
VLPHLALDDRLAERGSVFSVRNGVLERQARGRRGAHRGDEPLGLEVLHQVHEALVLFTEQVVLGNADRVEEELGRVRSVVADLLELLGHREPRQRGGHEEERTAVRARLGVGLGEERDEIGARAVGDERLLPVDHVVAALAAGDGADAGDVGTGRRLGHTERRDFLAAKGRLQEFVDLELRSDVGDDRRRHVALHEEPHRHAGRAPARVFLGLRDAEPVVAASAAVLFREMGAENAEVARLLEQRVGEKSVFFPFIGIRTDLALDEGPDHLPELLVLFLEGLEHRPLCPPS